MINFHRKTHMKYSTMSTQWTSSYNRSELPLVAEFTIAATASRSDTHKMWLIDDDDTLTASTVTDTRQIGSPLAEAEVEEETDLFLKTVAKTLWGLLCVLDVVI